MKRRWFQIHLSTVVVVMFVAGVMLWANLVERTESNMIQFFGDAEGRWAQVESHKFGWPITVHEYTTGALLTIRNYHIVVWPYIVDGVIALATIFSGVVICEWRIRRREARAK